MCKIMTYELSKHAQERCQQRAVPQEIVDLAVRFAEVAQAPRRAQCLFFTRRSYRRMEAAGICRKDIQMIEKKKNLRIIVSDDCVITAMYAHQSNKRIKRYA